jgi:hypothetical protein
METVTWILLGVWRLYPVLAYLQVPHSTTIKIPCGRPTETLTEANCAAAIVPQTPVGDSEHIYVLGASHLNFL